MLQSHKSAMSHRLRHDKSPSIVHRYVRNRIISLNNPRRFQELFWWSLESGTTSVNCHIFAISQDHGIFIEIARNPNYRSRIGSKKCQSQTALSNFASKFPPLLTINNSQVDNDRRRKAWKILQSRLVGNCRAIKVNSPQFASFCKGKPCGAPVPAKPICLIPNQSLLLRQYLLDFLYQKPTTARL